MSAGRSLLILAGVTLSIACDPAAGREATIGFRIASERRDGGPPGDFTTSTGWTVHLEAARLSAGPIYLYENAPPAASLHRWWRLDRWLVPAARAHAGDQHFAGGAVLAEYVGQVSFDALSPTPVDLGTTPATVARALSFSLRLDPAGGADETPLRGHQAYVRGTAMRGDVRVDFAGTLDLPAQGSQRRVEGLPLEADLDDGGVMTLVVHPDAWFDAADFATLPAAADGGVRTITADGAVRAAWMAGVRGYRSYTGRWTR
jgi:hypothetical protein